MLQAFFGKGKIPSPFCHHAAKIASLAKYEHCILVHCEQAFQEKQLTASSHVMLPISAWLLSLPNAPFYCHSQLQSEVEKPLLNFRENFKKDMKKYDHHIADLRKQLASRYTAVEKVRAENEAE